MARLGGWARRNMDALFAVARNLAPILVVTYQGKTFVLVSRHDDVRKVMSLPNVFRVPYAPKIRVIMGSCSSNAGRLTFAGSTRMLCAKRLTDDALTTTMSGFWASELAL